MAEATGAYRFIPDVTLLWHDLEVPLKSADLSDWVQATAGLLGRTKP